MNPGASIIIVTFNSIETIADCLISTTASLRANDEILIIDNNSQDNTKGILQGLPIDHLIVLKENILAVTARSASFPQRELNESIRLAKLLKADHLLIDSEELEDANYRENPPDRCYYCKSDLFGKLNKIAEEKNIPYVLDGANLDDAGDYRPGSKAAENLRIRSPLKEAKLTKEDIRHLSKEKNLPTWNKPSFACLASRFPYGTTITEEKLLIVEQAENILHDLGFSQFRLRHHDDLARIEVSKEQLQRFLNNGISERVITELKRLGYKYVTVDLEGYRSGSMNDAMKKK